MLAFSFPPGGALADRGEHEGGHSEHGHGDGGRFDGFHGHDHDHWRHGGGGWGWGGYWGPGWYPGWGFGMGLYDPFWYPPPPTYYAPPPVYGPAPAPVPAPTPAPAYAQGFYQWSLGIQRGQCDRTRLSQAAGGVAGVSVEGPEHGAVLGGVFVGPMVEGPVAAKMDVVDHACIMQTLEYAKTGMRVTWQTADGTLIRVVPVRTYFREDNQPCREYQVSAMLEGTDQTTHAVACRNPYGSWEPLAPGLTPETR